MMTKKDFIELADFIKDYSASFTEEAIEKLAQHLSEQCPNFKETLWIAYIRGECGPSGGKPRASTRR
jgi:hypothetical protein